MTTLAVAAQIETAETLNPEGPRPEGRNPEGRKPPEGRMPARQNTDKSHVI